MSAEVRIGLKTGRVEQKCFKCGEWIAASQFEDVCQATGHHIFDDKEMKKPIIKKVRDWLRALGRQPE
jgi:hypothetical protein